MGKKGKAIWWRWSIVSAMLGTLILVGYYLIAGHVPVADKLILWKGKWVLDLPFPTSRWWDILIGPAVATYYCLVLQNPRIKEDETTSLAVYVVGLVSLSFSLWGGVGFGVLYGLGLGFFFAICLYALVGIIAILVFLLPSKEFWRKTWKWLLVKE